MDLRQFLKQLVADRQLIEIDEAISCDLLLAALSRQEFRRADGGSALKFVNIIESDDYCATNLFGNEKRLLRLLGCTSFTEFSAKVEAATAGSYLQEIDRNLTESVPGRTELEQRSHIDLNSLPAIRSWPGEKNPYFTLGLTLTQDPQTASINLGLYRAQVISDKEIALNFSAGSGADSHWQKARQRNQKLPVALFFGSDPLLLWAAAAPLPEAEDEISFCRRAFGRVPAFTSCLTQPLSVPADAELVIEGFIGPESTCHEGPFGNHTGQYVSRSDCPLLKVTAIRSRPQPIIPVTIVGPPPSENVFLAKANEILIFHQIKRDYPQIVGLKMPETTAFHGVSLLQVRHPLLKDNRDLIEKLWSKGPLRRARFILLLDEDISLNSFSRCWWRAINMLQNNRLYRKGNQLAVDATGVDPTLLVREEPQIDNLLDRYRDNS